MKRISVYVVTYNNEERLNENASRFFKTTENVDRNRFELIYNVINNHPIINLHDEFKNRTNIMHNLRPEFSCGHLSRDYNTALIHGFHNLNAPYSQQVICVHDDSIWHDDWFDKLQTIHETYTFYVGDYGCSMTSYLPDAVKRIGIWDERFCNIGYHEADFFLRARIYNRDKSTINDHFGGRVLNPTEVLFDHPEANGQKVVHSERSLQYHTCSRKVFEDKWNVHPEQWDSRLGEEPSRPKIVQYMFYPYFELDIEDLEGKNYSYTPAGLQNFKSEWR